MSKIDLYNDDCFNIFPQIEDNSIDMILCDLPYGTTALKWDSVLPFDKLWSEYERIIKDNGVIALFATQPFTSMLICSNVQLYRYNWIWKKDGPTGFLNANYAPLKLTEDICVFSKGTVGSLSKNKITYHPQGVVAINKTKKNNPNSSYRASQGYSTGGNLLNSDKEYVQKYTNYPSNILDFARDKKTIHPTQKPVSLLEYLIRTIVRSSKKLSMKSGVSLIGIRISSFLSTIPFNSCMCEFCSDVREVYELLGMQNMQFPTFANMVLIVCSIFTASIFSLNGYPLDSPCNVIPILAITPLNIFASSVNLSIESDFELSITDSSIFLTSEVS